MARTSGREITVDRVRVRVLPDGRLDADNAARYMGRSPKTLAQWRLHGKGPPAHKVGGRVFYYLDELDAYIAAEGN
jgi:Helix-turn-helix domain